MHFPALLTRTKHPRFFALSRSGEGRNAGVWFWGIVRGNGRTASGAAIRSSSRSSYGMIGAILVQINLIQPYQPVPRLGCNSFVSRYFGIARRETADFVDHRFAGIGHVAGIGSRRKVFSPDGGKKHFESVAFI